MKISGNLKKMQSATGPQVKYGLPVGDQCVDLNPLIGKPVSLEFDGVINCVHCGRKTSKSYSQGYCYPCMQSLAECDICIIKPELCHYHEGTCREPEWGETHCFKPHVVYLANTSGLKVGITRQVNIPMRWIDQGAVQALPVFRTRDRFTAGKLEVVMKQHVADRTDWRRMLKSCPDTLDLAAARDSLYDVTLQEIESVAGPAGDAWQVITEAPVVALQYPVQQYPEKVKSLNFDKQPDISGVLEGIKGQYLILDTGVLNIRKFGGYLITFSA